ncbi:MAG: MMPL family transporter [Clostridia bacterium]|nr:MMPL family transporter [Clostridia bacterium]
MYKVTLWMIKHRVLIVIICLALLVPSILGMAATKTKYDLLYYLPSDLETVKGQEILIDDFGVGGVAMLVSEGLTQPELSKLESEISSIDNVRTVVGYASLSGGLPIGLMPEKVRQMFSNGDCMLSFVLFEKGTSSEETMEAVQKIRRTASEKCFLSGLTAVVTDTKELIESQEIIYVAIAVALCAVVLTLTMDSFLLPLLFLASIGVSILWNLGSNYFLGEISYVTKAVAAVLQLGVTMDYSIFLWHSYKEQCTLTEDKDAAMANAIGQTFSSILGSSLTTMAGFISLCFMSFTLGRDLGIVMTKGVVMGFIGTIVLLPCAVRIMDKPIRRTAHKPLLPKLDFIGKLVSKHYVILFVIVLVLVFPAFYGYNSVKVYYDMSTVLPEDLPSVQANKKLNRNFDMSTVHLVLLDSRVEGEELKTLTKELGQVDGVNSVLSYASLDDLGAMAKLMLPGDLIKLIKSDNYQLMLINSEYVISSDEVNAQIDSLNGIIKRCDPDGMLIGEAPCTKDLIACTDTDFKVVSLISIIAIFVIILLVQRSISLPVLLVALIELAIALNLCIPYYTGTELPFVGPILISTIQLGATVDYAILLTTRYKQRRLEGLDKKQAINHAVSSSAQSIIVSSLSFFAATFGVGLYSDIDIVSSMCLLIARGSLLSAVVVMFLLPAVLALLDKAIIKTTLDMRRLK